jgi:hypothetical protein
VRYDPDHLVSRGKVNFFASNPDDNDEKIYVFYSPEKSVGIKTMRAFIGILDEQSIGRGILIYHTNITPAANKVRRRVHVVMDMLTRCAGTPTICSPSSR